MTEQPSNSEQHTVDILAVTPDEQAYLYDAMQDADTQMATIVGLSRARVRNYDSYTQRDTRIDEYGDELLEDYSAISSSLTVSETFHKIYEELSTQYNVPHEEIIQIYQKCLKAYINHPEIPQRPERIDTNTRKNLLQYVSAEIPVPGWWPSGLKDWQHFLIMRIHFPTLIHAGKGITHLNKSNTYMPECYHHIVFPDQLPDWYDELHALPPEDLIKKVQIEFEEDYQTKERLCEQLDQIPVSKKRLADHFGAKNDVYNEEMAQIAVDLDSKGMRDLRSFMLYLPAFLQTFNPYNYDFTKPEDIKRGIQKMCDRYFDIHVFDKDIVALWLENNFQQLQIGSKDGIPLEAVTSILRGINDPEAYAKLWLPLKDQDKQLYRFLRFSFGQLLSYLSEEELEILAQYMESEELPTALQEIAGNISEHTNTYIKHAREDSNLVKTHKAIETFGRNWIVEHASEYRAKLVSKLKSYSSTTATKPVPDTDAIPETNGADETNPLTTWNLLYTTRIHSPSPDHMITIEGNSVDEITQALEDVLRAHKIHISVKPMSIINCLEQIITTPEEVEYFTPHLGDHYSEVDYKKRKRGKVRILYRMDPQEKSLVFWLHQKKHQGYRLH